MLQHSARLFFFKDLTLLYLIKSSSKTYEGSTIGIPISEMRKWRQREINFPGSHIDE